MKDIIETLINASERGHKITYAEVEDGETCADCEADCPGCQSVELLDQFRGFPVVVCLCGSTRFGGAFAAATLEETLAGKIVLSIGCNMRSDSEIFGHLPPEELTEIKRKLDALHKQKIDLSDEVLILNVGGYIGDSTRSEMLHAKKRGKTIRFLEPDKAPKL